MRILLFACAISLVGIGVCSVDPPVSTKTFLSQLRNFIKSRREAAKGCHADVRPLKWMGIKQANDDTSDAARSYYNKFNITVSRGYEQSKFQIAVEYKSPEIVPIGNRKVTVNWQNLLFTSSLLVHKKSQMCQKYAKSYLGFVELIRTDKTWYKYRNNVIEHGEWNLGSDVDPDLQYVMTKPSKHAKHMFADNNTVPLYPVDYNRIIQLKYESSENITIDFKQHPEALEYEKLIEKKIFLVQVNPSGNQALEIIAGVDVIMYLNYLTYIVTDDTVQLTLNKNHSLMKWIVDAEKYTSILNDNRNHVFRDRKLKRTSSFQNPNVVTLNPLLDGQHILYSAE